MNNQHSKIPIVDYQLGMIYLFMYMTLISGNIYLSSITIYFFIQKYIDTKILKKENSITTSIFMVLYSIIEYIKIYRSLGKYIHSIVVLSMLILLANIMYNKITVEEVILGCVYLILYYNIEQDLLSNWSLYIKDKQNLIEFITS